MMHLHVYTLILSLIGFMIAFHIWHTKKNNEQLACFIGKDCNIVIHSKHSEALGVENSILGMIYYIFVIVVSLVMLLYPMVFHISFFMTGFTIVVGVAALFSVYLASIQLFKLREFCEYCLANTAIVVATFIITLVL